MVAKTHQSTFKASFVQWQKMRIENCLLRNISQWKFTLALQVMAEHRTDRSDLLRWSWPMNNRQAMWIDRKHLAGGLTLAVCNVSLWDERKWRRITKQLVPKSFITIITIYMWRRVISARVIFLLMLQIKRSNLNLNLWI